MLAVILNSGMGTRLGELTEDTPKCMTEINETETILSRQISQLEKAGISDFLITTGPFEKKLMDYIDSLGSNSNFSYVNNPDYASTNYIYSLFLAKEKLNRDIILLHGDLVFSQTVADMLVNCDKSCMTVSSTQPIPTDDFKAIISEDKITAIGVQYYDHPDAVTAQPFYNLKKDCWLTWLKQIEKFVQQKNTSVYAENAFNEISAQIHLSALDVKDNLCAEIDTPEDLKRIQKILI